MSEMTQVEGQEENRGDRKTQNNQPGLNQPAALNTPKCGLKKIWWARTLCGCVWKHSTMWEESRIWQVQNLLAPTKEMPASGIHQCVLYEHTPTHTAALSYLLSQVQGVLVSMITCWS